jgi:hypothetical protein
LGELGATPTQVSLTKYNSYPPGKILSPIPELRDLERQKEKKTILERR